MGGWVLITVGGLCAGTVRTLMLHGGLRVWLGLWAVTVGSYMYSGLADYLVRITAYRSPTKVPGVRICVESTAAFPGALT